MTCSRTPAPTPPPLTRAICPCHPRGTWAIVACMDARLNPCGLLGLAEGDAHVIRNAGGVITDDEIRSLTISQRLLGTREIILIHHTDCGMLTFTDNEFKAEIEADTGLGTSVGTRVFPGPRSGREAVSGADRGQPVPPAQRPVARLCLLRDRRVAHRDHLRTTWAISRIPAFVKRQKSINDPRIRQESHVWRRRGAHPGAGRLITTAQRSRVCW